VQLLALARATLAAGLLRAGEHAEAVSEGAAAMAEVEARGSLEHGEARVRLIQVDVLKAAGGADGARAAAAAARDRLLVRAAHITNQAWRESFLTRVPDNARTLQLAEELVEEGRDGHEGPLSAPQRPAD
jgi:hypothetical protein